MEFLLVGLKMDARFFLDCKAFSTGKGGETRAIKGVFLG